MKLVYGACLYPLKNKAGYSVIVPDLPGCISQGKDLADTIAMAVDAASGWILDELESEGNVPPSTPLEDIRPDPEFGNGFITAIVLDMDRYTEKYGSKAVRKNVTIPHWLNVKAEKAGINFSQVLKEALEQKLKVS
jgi:predicted RNase H-like HicB family nuclease